MGEVDKPPHYHEFRQPLRDELDLCRGVAWAVWETLSNRVVPPEVITESFNPEEVHEDMEGQADDWREIS